MLKHLRRIPPLEEAADASKHDHSHAEICAAASAHKLSPFRGPAAALSIDASTRSESGCNTPPLVEEGTECAATYVQQQNARGAGSDIAGSCGEEDLGFVCSETSPPDFLKDFQKLMTVDCQEPFNELALLPDENVEAPESFSPFGGSPTDSEMAALCSTPSPDGLDARTARLPFLEDSPNDCSVNGEDLPTSDATAMGDDEAWFFANFVGF